MSRGKPVTNPKISAEDLNELYSAWEEAQKRGVWKDEANSRLHRAIITVTFPTVYKKRFRATWKSWDFKEFHKIFVSDEAYSFIYNIIKKKNWLNDQGLWDPKLKKSSLPSFLKELKKKGYIDRWNDITYSEFVEICKYGGINTTEDKVKKAPISNHKDIPKYSPALIK